MGIRRETDERSLPPPLAGRWRGGCPLGAVARFGVKAAVACRLRSAGSRSLRTGGRRNRRHLRGGRGTGLGLDVTEHPCLLVAGDIAVEVVGSGRRVDRDRFGCAGIDVDRDVEILESGIFVIGELKVVCDDAVVDDDDRHRCVGRDR